MVAVKAHQAEAFLKAPDGRLALFLFFGTDAGLVSERAKLLAEAIAKRENPPGDILRLDDSDLETDPDRLGIELRTVPMFGGRKIVRATTGRRITALTLKPLVQEGNLAGVLIVEAGNLKSDDSLRQTFEKSDKAAAIACYADEAADLEAVVRQALQAARRTMAPEARELLVSRLGADRVMTRGEIEKLLLYTDGKGEITADDVEAVVGDASDLAMDRILVAVASGDAGRAVSELGRSVTSGESAQGIILATLRYFQRLHRLRTALDQGGSIEDLLRNARPPIHFKQKPALAAQCRMWTAARLTQALSEISAAAKSARFNAPIEDMLAERLLLKLAFLARAGAAREKAR